MSSQDRAVSRQPSAVSEEPAAPGGTPHSALRTPHSALLAVLLLLGLLLRLPGLGLLGTGDVRVWKVWANAATTHGLTQAYPLAHQRPGVWPPLSFNSLDQVRRGRITAGSNVYDHVSAPTDYPPGAVMVLWAVGGIYRAFFAPDFANSTPFNVLIKLPLVLADALAAWLIFAFVRKRAGPERVGIAWAAALAYWCNPTPIIAGPVLGYLDALFGLPLVLALGLLAAGRYAGGWAAWGTSLMLKLQALFVAPALALLSLRRGPARVAGYAAAALGTVFAFCAPFLLRGTFVGVLAGIANNAQEDYLSANACNLWWLWSYFWEWNAEGKGPGALVRIVPISEISDLHVADLNAWAVGLFAAFILLTGLVWAAARRGGAEPPGVADLFLVPLQLYGATMLLPSIHENHLLAVLPLLALLGGLAAAGGKAGHARQLVFLYVALSLEIALNLLLFYGFGKGTIAPIPRVAFGMDLTVLVAAANVLLFAATLAVWGVGLFDPRNTRKGTKGTKLLEAETES
ncbi:MAG: hypothetical protein ACR2M0_02035 [Chloroflexia bacterium]